jgi:hypothetical protein
MYLGWRDGPWLDGSFLDWDDGTQLYLVAMDDVKAVKAYLEEQLDRVLAIPMPANLVLLSCPTGTCVVCKQLQ